MSSGQNSLLSIPGSSIRLHGIDLYSSWIFRIVMYLAGIKEIYWQSILKLSVDIKIKRCRWAPFHTKFVFLGKCRQIWKTLESSWISWILYLNRVRLRPMPAVAKCFIFTCRFNKDGHLELLNDGFLNNSVNIVFFADLLQVKNRRLM